MIISPLKTYRYNTSLKKLQKDNVVKSDIQVNEPNVEAFKNFKMVSFGANTSDNWTEGTLKGYPEQIRQLQNILIEPIKSSDRVAAPIVIIYSPDKDVANLVKTGVTKALNHINKIDLNNNDNENFDTKLSRGLAQGLRNYKTNGKKSLIMLDNIERYINISDKEIPRLQKDFSHIFKEEDYKRIRDLGNNISNINILKNTLDYCSSIPKKEYDINAATSIFSVSEKPQIIDSELLRRPEKLYTIVFPPLYGEAFANILHNEVEKQDEFVQSLRFLTDKEIEKIDMPYNSWKSLQKLKTDEGRTFLDLKSSKIPYKVIAEFCSPDDKYGAFLAKQIPEIVQQATYKYIEKPEQEFISCLLKELKNTKRLLTPQDLAMENEVKNFIELKEKTVSTKNLQQIDKMLKAYKAGFVPEKRVSRLVSEIINSEINSIKKGQEITNPYESLKHKSVLDRLKSKYILSRIDKLSENRYKFSYQDGKSDYVDLYLGSFGWKKETLWIDSSDLTKVALTKYFLKEIKNIDEFSEVKVIEFPADSTPNSDEYENTGRFTLAGKPIYSLKLEDTNEDK